MTVRLGRNRPPRRVRRLRSACINTLPWALLVLASVASTGCMNAESEAAESDAASPGGGKAGAGGGKADGRSGASGYGPGGSGGAPGSGGPRGSSIPVQVVAAERRTIAQYLETNGTLEAENDIDLVARITGPIVELLVEEGMAVDRGQLLARIDPREIEAQLTIARVRVDETRIALDRARRSFEAELLARELLDQAASAYDSALAQFESQEVQRGYTEIRAPFSGQIVERHIKLAQHVQPSTPLFRIADFDPLECPIQVPEKDLARMAQGQPAYLTVEAYPAERYDASVLRVSPIVDSATGTVEVTLEVATRGRLRPGMFASVYLETDRRTGALVVPKSALVLESIGDTVYVMAGDVAERREVRLGYDEADAVEVLEGLSDGDQVIVLGQDSLSDGTPVYVLESDASRSRPPGAAEAAGDTPTGVGPGPPPGFDPSNLTPEMIGMMRERMKSRGMSDKQIEQRIEAIRKGEAPRRPGSSGPPE